MLPHVAYDYTPKKIVYASVSPGLLTHAWPPPKLVVLFASPPAALSIAHGWEYQPRSTGSQMSDLQRQFLEYLRDFNAIDDPDSMLSALASNLTELPDHMAEILDLPHGSTSADGVRLLNEN